MTNFPNFISRFRKDSSHWSRGWITTITTQFYGDQQHASKGISTNPSGNDLKMVLYQVHPPPEQSENVTNYKPSFSTLNGWLRPSYFFSKRPGADVQMSNLINFRSLPPSTLLSFLAKYMHEESDSETKPVTINQWFGVVEPPNVIFVTSIEAGCSGCTFFFPAGLTVCCIWCIRNQYDTFHSLNKHTKQQVQLKTQPMNALKWAPTQSDKFRFFLVHHEGDFSCYLSLGSRQVTTSPRARRENLLGSPGCEMLRRQGSWMRRLGRWTVFRLCFFSSCFLWGWFLGFFLLLFSYGFLLVLFFFGLDDFLHFPPKIRHKTSRRWEVFKSWLVNLPPHKPPSRPRNKALLRAWFPSIRPY